MVQEITINRPFADVWEIVIQTIRQIGWDLVMSDENHGRITSTTPSSLRSWGESVNITLANHEGMILVTISSNPRAQLIDWGKSGENETIFIREIRRRLRS